MSKKYIKYKVKDISLWEENYVSRSRNAGLMALREYKVNA